jgi:hypothetical protein
VSLLLTPLTANPRNAGGSYEAGAPWRLVLHMTQTPRGKGRAAALARVHDYPPHLWYDWQHDELAASVPLDRAAFALLHRSSDPATNKRGAIQIELLGYSEDAHEIPDSGLARIGALVRRIRDLLDAETGRSFDLSGLNTVGSQGYGSAAPQRMSWSAWRSFNAVCAHQHVPGNHHWDAGRLNIHRICEHARGTDDTDTEEWDMAIGDELLAKVDRLSEFTHLFAMQLFGDEFAFDGLRGADVTSVKELADRLEKSMLTLAVNEIEATRKAIAEAGTGPAGVVTADDLLDALHARLSD